MVALIGATLALGLVTACGDDDDSGVAASGDDPAETETDQATTEPGVVDVTLLDLAIVS